MFKVSPESNRVSGREQRQRSGSGIEQWGILAFRGQEEKNPRTEREMTFSEGGGDSCDRGRYHGNRRHQCHMPLKSQSFEG